MDDSLGGKKIGKITVKSGPIALIHLAVEGAEVVNPADAEESASEQPEDAGEDFPKIKAVDPERTEERLEDPRQTSITDTFSIANIRPLPRLRPPLCPL